MLEQSLPVARQMLAVKHRRLQLVGVEQLFQQLLALKLRALAQVFAVEPQKVKGAVQQTILAAAGEFSLQLGEAGAAFVDNDDLAINDRLTGNIERASDDGESFGPVETITGVCLSLPSIEVKLDPVAVVLDLVEPLVA